MGSLAHIGKKVCTSGNFLFPVTKYGIQAHDLISLQKENVMIPGEPRYDPAARRKKIADLKVKTGIQYSTRTWLLQSSPS